MPRNALVVGGIGVVLFLIGLTAGLDWTWVLTWLGIALVVVAVVMAVAGKGRVH